MEELAGLTYREARTVLASKREDPVMLANEWGVTLNALDNYERRGLAKIKKAGYTAEQFMERIPIGMINY
jgi:hypothetical protein